ncbi:proprotein convertase subtilisin/kexin type 4-like [Mercenaria mercenaria]|uniref:proprotein convertase subtilisin/kexin type 4-like n=1 Tax=Mercenaria mercenaria TaxID=6596 RepID=UPI00234F2AE2|nr:proprotein convertase subtilisin/kexin type 4-like [Mercenaria mercenaria]XP_053392497.1 proprotein convertase subtilisin/kexin type 4-like [Mercenaria mercenaria]
MARSHVYGDDNIDIYSNSWGADKPFYKMNLDQREAIKTSAKKGRGGQGAAHIFPVGASGNELANNEYTITVVAVGQNGTVPSDSVISSSVITSGLRNGNNLTADFMVTTSQGNKCITSFAGVSAATAQVSGMIALALEANPLLTLSDMQDLIVYSSEVHCLKKSSKHMTNAAGHKFHSVFGFGLLNALKLVDKAEKKEEGAEFHPHTLRQITSCFDEREGFTASFCYSCTQNEDSFLLVQECLQKVKTAKVQVKYTTSADYMRMTLISPSGTVSVLQELESKYMSTISKERKQILTSVHFWDEAPSGIWRFSIQSDGKTEVKGNVALTLIGIAVEITQDKAMVKDTFCATTCSTAPSQGLSCVTILISLTLAFLVAVM